ncbi:MAG: hypothetical protein KDD19_23285 [Phaeodactylibacter sp.]|nr:hypothetical protein [Phaeodactylibacter sp.]MCB9053488.1 hypothetical protein [Lewinellaceae bacterium]
MIIRRVLIVFSLLLAVSLTPTDAQSSWQSGRYYASRGQTATQTTYRNEWNTYYGSYVNARYCRKLNWYQEYHSGYVYYWRYDPYYNSYRWASEWKEGYFWYCTWSNWYGC